MFMEKPRMPKKSKEDPSIIIGTEFYATHADSRSKWVVRKSLGSYSYLCEIVNDPITIDGTTYPGEWNGVQKSFLTEEIIEAIGWQLHLENIADENERFLQSQNPGTILHYHDGFGNYVRNIVVREGNVNKLKSIALVGKWKSHDLPVRRPDGTIYNPYHVQKILSGALQDGLQCSTTYEHPSFVKPKKEDIDPRKLEPINLELPEMDVNTELASKMWQLVEQVQDRLKNQDQKEDPFDPRTPLRRLQEAYELLEPLNNVYF